MPLPPPDAHSALPPPPSQPAVQPEHTMSRHCPTYKTQPNSFGLFQSYDRETLPSQDPEYYSGEYPLPGPSQVHSSQHAEDVHGSTDNPLYPYPNENSLRLSGWYWNQGSRKSKDSFKRLLEIVGSMEFRSEDVQNTKWTQIDCKIGCLDITDSPEWLDDDAGWERTIITISVPFPQCSLHPGPKMYTVTDFYHRSLMSLVCEKVLDPTYHHLFHYEPFELLWHPPHRSHDVKVHGELYNSEAFLKAHCKLQKRPPEPGCDLPHHIVALMFWSDATQLTLFGGVKLWPLVNLSIAPAKVISPEQVCIRARSAALKQDDPIPNAPEQHHAIGKSQNFPVNITSFVQSNLDDPAAKDFVQKLKHHLLPHLWDIHVDDNRSMTSQTLTSQSLLDFRPADNQSLLSALSQVVFKGGRIYWHPLFHINYTTYDLHRETDAINPSTDCCDIMLLVQRDSPGSHPFCYARVLAIYYANIIYTGPKSKDYHSQHLDFYGRLHSNGVAISRNARDAEDWKFYYINRFVDRDMLMRYHWGLGVGHLYACIPKPTKNNESFPQNDSGQSDVTPANAAPSNNDPDMGGLGDTDEEGDDEGTLWTDSEEPANDDSEDDDIESDSDVLLDAMYDFDDDQDDIEDIECEGYKF
ncbi:hypothetical protein HYDPIDRAFT_31838 [Hydnomerulius pinastri MD-312]|uniref:Uncharacterized protein n=1 Tax=Hydnomerulius pinastri MD-312 TaxID=994086 RepID=A0A0C9WBN2_9AGAM|nr:hypothetical protein HYDPIDRAFT_31838 [Hydnomerulius pinastri MD-312]